MKEVTVLITDEDFESMMRCHAANRPEAVDPKVAVHMVVAVEGDRDYNLNQFETRDEEATIKGLNDKGVLTVVLPSGARVLAKRPGEPYHYANNSQAYKKVLELRAKGVNAFVVGHGKPAKHIRIVEGA